MRAIEEIIIHTSDSSFGDAKFIKEWHLERGWDTIGYHSVVLNGHRHSGDDNDYMPNEDGFIENGREYDVEGAGVSGHNESSLHLCLIGENGIFTPKQMTAMYVRILSEMRAFKVPIANVKGHYEYDTANGKTCPDLDMNEVRKTLKNILQKTSCN